MPPVLYDAIYRRWRDAIVSTRSDNLALGLTMYEILHGHPPHHPMEAPATEQTYGDERYAKFSRYHITRCRMAQYDSAQDLLIEVEAEVVSFEASTAPYPQVCLCRCHHETTNDAGRNCPEAMRDTLPAHLPISPGFVYHSSHAFPPSPFVEQTYSLNR